MTKTEPELWVGAMLACAALAKRPKRPLAIECLLDGRESPRTLTFHDYTDIPGNHAQSEGKRTMSYDTSTAKGQTVGHSPLHAVESIPLCTRIDAGLDEMSNHLHDGLKGLQDVFGQLFGPVPVPPASNSPSSASCFEDRIAERLAYMVSVADQIRYLTNQLGARI